MYHYSTSTSANQNVEERHETEVPLYFELLQP